jgi:hypothetical protein
MKVAALILALAVCPAGMDVRPVGPGRVDVVARTVSLADALECLSQRSGVKVVYDGLSAPRQLVSVSLHDATVAEAIEKLFEGHGLNYALGVDPEGRGAGLLVVSPVSTATASATSRPGRPPVSEPLIEEVQPELDPDVPSAGDAVPTVEPPIPPGVPGYPGAQAYPGAPNGLGGSAGPGSLLRPLFPEPLALTPTAF